MKLWLIRHAKSDWSSPASSDFERPLNRRGERDGPRMARWLATLDHPATWVWTSDAARAQATAAFVVQGFQSAQPALAPEHRLYDASPERLLDVLKETPPEHQSVALVAHNPGLTYLVNLLSGEQVTENLPTFGVTRFDVPEPWTELAFGAARLELFNSPKRLDPTTPAAP